MLSTLRECDRRRETREPCAYYDNMHIAKSDEG